MSTLTVQNIQGSTSSSNTINVASGHKITGAAGSIVAPGQVIQVINGPGNVSRTATTSTSYVDTNITATITPKFASSKILINWNTMVYQNSSNVYAYFKLVRNIGGGSFSDVDTSGGDSILDAYGTPWQSLFSAAIDTPNTTSACVYKVQTASASGTNYVGWSTNASYRNMMNITLMEIAQ